MPRVPQYSQNDAPTVSPNPVPSFRQSSVVTPDFLASSTDQTARMGQALGNLGGTLADAQINAAREVNQLRVTAADDGTRQVALDLTFNDKYGYLRQKGLTALERASGKDITDEYGEKFDEHVAKTAASLGNDAQRRAYTTHAASMKTQFLSGVQHHKLNEFNNYHLSVADGSMKLSADEAKLNWNHPDKIDAAINGVEDAATGQRFGGVKEAIYQKARLTGLSAAETEVEMKKAESSIHAQVIEAALENNNATYGFEYFNKNRAGMTADDILKINGQANTHMDAHNATQAVNASLKKYSSQFAPTGMDKLTNIVLSIESGGKDMSPDGSPVISSKGAKYAMQVMPETAANPGFGIEAAKADTPEEYNRVGRQLLAALVEKYGDPAKALAAYNAGSGRVDEALKKVEQDGFAGQSWLDLMPKETRDYVQKGTAKLEEGSGAPALPTKLAFVNEAVGALGENARPEAMKLARDYAEKQYELVVAARKDQADQALAQAQQALIANGGNFAALPPKVLSDLARFDPGKYDDAKKFAKSLSSETATNPEAYAMAVMYPDELARMPEGEFLQFLKTNFSPSDQEKILKLRMKTDDSSEAINNEALNTAISGRLIALEINPSPKKDDADEMARIGAIQKFVRDDIYAQQRQLGRKMTAKEVEDRVDLLFAQRATAHGFFGNSEKSLMELTISDLPNKALKALRAEFELRGNKDPTDSELVRAYWSLKRRMKNG